MRKVLIGLALASVVALGTSGGAGADGQGADWLVAGTGTLAPPPQFGQPMLHVNAQSNFGGGNARGHFWIRYPNGAGEFGGHVICLTVVANQAWLVGQIETVRAPRASFVVGNYVNMRLIDNGSPGTLDGANFDPGTPTPDTCPSGNGYVPISQGNYVVHDQPVTDPLGLQELLAQIALFESAAGDPYG
jgi:hypothetical protein